MLFRSLCVVVLLDMNDTHTPTYAHTHTHTHTHTPALEIIHRPCLCTSTLSNSAVQPAFLLQESCTWITPLCTQCLLHSDGISVIVPPSPPFITGNGGGVSARDHDTTINSNVVKVAGQVGRRTSSKAPPCLPDGWARQTGCWSRGGSEAWGVRRREGEGLHCHDSIGFQSSNLIPTCCNYNDLCQSFTSGPCGEYEC